MDADKRAAAPLPPPASPPNSRALAAWIPAARTGYVGTRESHPVRRMTIDDLPFVVTEHLENFPDGFFAKLGPGFLTRYCTTYLTSPHAKAYIAEDGGRSVGFLLGVLHPAAHRRHLLAEHGRGLLTRGLACLATRPRLAVRFLRTRFVRYFRSLTRGRGPAHNDRDTAGTTAVLAYIAVNRRWRSQGAGGDLILRFVADAGAAGCTRVSLVTSAGDDGAGRYYERRGWLRRGETSTPDGRPLAAYDLPLRDPRLPGVGWPTAPPANESP